MKNIALILFLILFSCAAVSAQTVAFTNVNVIPMDTERVLENQTVLIKNGIIAEIGRKVKIPKNAQVIDAAGKYLIPGLVDMHTHLLSDGDDYPDAIAEDELRVMVANGVTTLRFMIGTPEQLVLRAKAAKGEIVAPQIYSASPHLTGREQGNNFVVNTPEEAREAVRKSKATGYDFIKITTFIKAEAYEAAVDEAARQNIRVVGHADARFVGVQRALKARQQIEHLDGYLEELLADNAPSRNSISDLYIYDPKNWESIDYVDESKIAKIARQTVEANPFVDPTQHFMKNTFGLRRPEESIRAQPDFRFYPAKVQEQWLNFYRRNRFINQVPYEKRARWVEIRNKLIKAIYDAGGRIMAGSDTPEFLWLYGFTMHRELKALADAGLSNYAALEAATKNPSMFFGTLDKVGTIEKGRRADLILLDANPLENISHTERRTGVMLKGKYFAQSELNKWLDAAAQKISSSYIEKKTQASNDKATREKAAAALAALGAKIEYNAEKQIVKIDLSNARITDADLKNLAAFSELEWLDLRITSIGDEGVAQLKTLTKLKFLNLFRTNLSDKGLAELKDLTELETLLIGGTRVTNEGLQNLARFSRLRKISVFRTAVSDAGLKHLEKLPALEILLINESKITAGGAANLQKILPALRFNEQT